MTGDTPGRPGPPAGRRCGPR